MRHDLRPPMTTKTPTWQPQTSDYDLTSAACEHPTVGAWLDALVSLVEATMEDDNGQHLYGQAPDALRRRSIEPTSEAVEDSVQVSPEPLRR